MVISGNFQRSYTEKSRDEIMYETTQLNLVFFFKFYTYWGVVVQESRKSVGLLVSCFYVFLLRSEFLFVGYLQLCFGCVCVLAYVQINNDKIVSV